MTKYDKIRDTNENCPTCLKKMRDLEWWPHNPSKIYSTVTDFAKFLGLSTSNPFSLEI